MTKAEIADKALIINLLSLSFHDNQSVNYIINNDKNRIKRIRFLMDYSFDICYMFGDVWLSEKRNACALILYPQNKRASWKTIWLDLKLIVKTIGFSNIKKALERESKIKGKQPIEPIAYLWFIGVDPAYQHKGIGSKILNEVIINADEKKLPLCLETSTIKNLPWYKKFGFHEYEKLDLGYTLFFLKKNISQV